MNTLGLFWTTTFIHSQTSGRVSLRGWDLGHNLSLSQVFWWEIPFTVGFRPQLVIVSGLLVDNPFYGGI
jgi:hypothetical protein